MLVAGGGVAGVAAAIAAARSGCRVLLAEQRPSLGGTATYGMVGTICGLYANGGEAAGEPLNSGIAAEVAAALTTGPDAVAPRPVGSVFVLPYGQGRLSQLLATLCRQEEKLTLRCNARVTAVEVDGGRVQRLTLRQGDGETMVAAAVLVDCSGDGDVSAMAGAGFELSPPEELQLAGFMVRLTGIDDRGADLSLQIPFLAAKGVAGGQLPPQLRITTYAPGEEPGSGYLKISLPLAAVDSDSLRREAEALLAFLAGQLPALATAVIAGTSAGLFPREGRRIVGEYTLTADDIVSGRTFPDGVVRGAWPMELWLPGKGASYRYPPPGGYDIPLRCLKAKGVANLFMAGRCISVSHEALGSTRVIGTCLSLGEQAGKAAALMALGA